MKDPTTSSVNRADRRSLQNALVPAEVSNSAESSSKPKNTGRPRRAKHDLARQEILDAEYIYTPWTFLLSTQKQYVSVEQRLHDEIVAYVVYLQPTPQETTLREKVFARIQKVVKGRFTDGDVRLHGSLATGLSLPSADMDIVVSTAEAKNEKDRKRPLFQLSSMLKSAQLTWDVHVIHHARVPILSFETFPSLGAFHVDIGINNVDGVQAIEIVNGYIARMPALRPLILAVKGFLARRQLNSAANSGLCSYAVICMCISFLQLNPSNRPKDFIDKPMETESLGALFTDFLFYYGVEFPYCKSYISVTEGKLLPKASVPWIRKPEQNLLAIQCLIHPNNDVAKAATRMPMIRDTFKDGYSTILQLQVDNITMLKPLLGMNQETIDHRMHMCKIVDSGLLDASLSAPLPAQSPPRQRSYQSTYQVPFRYPIWDNPSPQNVAPIPFSLAFGGGSAMGRGNGFGRGDDGVNRRGSGFQNAGPHGPPLTAPLLLPQRQVGMSSIFGGEIAETARRDGTAPTSPNRRRKHRNGRPREGASGDVPRA